MHDDLRNKLLEYKNPVTIFLFGILTGATFYFKHLNLVYLILTFLVLLIFFRRKKILILAFSLFIGYLYPLFYQNVFSVKLDHLLGKKLIFVGEVLSDPDESSIFNKKYFFKILRIPELNQKVNLKVQLVGSLYEQYEVGDIVQTKGVLKKPKGALLPSFFNERNHLLTRGISYVLKGEPGTLVFLDQNNNFVRNKIYIMRHKIIEYFKKSLPFEKASLVNAILIGSKASNLSKELKEKIRDLGLSHITSASGFNVGILTFGIFSLFRIFTRNNFLPSIFSIFSILIYSAIADFSASIIRASIFIILVLAGNLFNKKLILLPGISIILLGFFLVSPFSLLDIGLELSCLSFLGIMLFSSKEIKFPFSILFLTLIAQIMITPLIVFYFHNIQLLGLVSNLLAIPVASMILVTSVISVLVSFLSPLSFLLFKLINFLSSFFIGWINFLYSFPFKTLFIPNINFYFLILIYISLFLLSIFFFLKESKKYFFHFLVIMIPSFLITHLLTDNNKHIKIFFIPKYNQEAILVIKPHEKPLFISNKIDKDFHEKLLVFLRLNNIPGKLALYNLNEDGNKLEINYKNFNLHIIKNYSKPIDKASCVKLPILMKHDPDLSMVFISYPEYLIVNDYKKLSKKSIQDIQYLKSLPIMSFFLSQSGSITLVSNGKKHKIVTGNE